MNVTTPGVVLSRKPYGEYGRMITLFTRDLGKVSARMAGVDRPKAKLKAFSEPMICAEYRLYLRSASPWAVVTGGRLIDTYPGLRGDLSRMLGGLEMCELLLRLTPEHAPSPRKYDLVTGFLAAYSEFPAPCLPVAFGLRLLELLGLGAMPAELDLELAELLCLELEPARLDRLRGSLRQTAEAYLQRPLNVPRVRLSMEAPMEAAAR